MDKKASPEKIATEYYYLKGASPVGQEYERLEQLIKENPKDRGARDRLFRLQERMGLPPGYEVDLQKETVTRGYRETGHQDPEDREWVEKGEKYKTLKDLVRYSLGENLRNAWLEMTRNWDGSLILKTDAEEEYSSDDDIYHEAFLKRLDGKPFTSSEIEYLKRKLGIRHVH